MIFSKSKILSGVGILVIIAIAVGIFWWQKNQPKLVKHLDRHLNAAQTELLQKQLDQAKQALKNLPKDATDKDKFLAYIQVAAQNFALGNLVESRSAYESAAKAVPDNPTPWEELYEVEINMQDYQAANKSIDKAIELNPSRVPSWQAKLTVEQTYLKAPEDQLETIYKQAIDKTNFVEFIATYADLLSQHGKLSESRDYWKRAVELAPTNDLYQSYNQSLQAVEAKLK